MSCEELERRLETYLKKAKPLFEALEAEESEMGKRFYEMATSYYKDALHFHERKKLIEALAALEYAEGWLDAGRLVGCLRVKEAEPSSRSSQ